MFSRFLILFTIVLVAACSDPLETEVGQDNLYGYWHIIGYRDNGGERLEDTEIAYAFFEADSAQRAFQGNRESFTLHWKDQENFELIPCSTSSHPCAPEGLNNFDIRAQASRNIELRHWILDQDGTKIYDQQYILERINAVDFQQF